jgi:hypothetical protein
MLSKTKAVLSSGVLCGYTLFCDMRFYVIFLHVAVCLPSE